LTEVLLKRQNRTLAEHMGIDVGSKVPEVNRGLRHEVKVVGAARCKSIDGEVAVDPLWNVPERRIGQRRDATRASTRTFWLTARAYSMQSIKHIQTASFGAPKTEALVGNPAGAEPSTVCGSEIVDAKVLNLCLTIS
jgi:hypothetical protein